MSSLVFSRTANRAVLKCQCGDRVARPGFAPEPGTPSLGAHVADHHAAAKADEHEQAA